MIFLKNEYGIEVSKDLDSSSSECKQIPRARGHNEDLGIYFNNLFIQMLNSVKRGKT